MKVANALVKDRKKGIMKCVMENLRKKPCASCLSEMQSQSHVLSSHNVGGSSSKSSSGGEKKEQKTEKPKSKGSKGKGSNVIELTGEPKQCSSNSNRMIIQYVI